MLAIFIACGGCGARTPLELPGAVTGTAVDPSQCREIDAVPIYVSTMENGPIRLALDDEFVYWARTLSPAGELMRGWKDGSRPPEVVSSNAQNARGIVRDGDRVYWVAEADAGSLVSAPASGGSPTIHSRNLRRPIDLQIAKGHAFIREDGTDLGGTSTDFNKAGIVVHDFARASEWRLASGPPSHELVLSNDKLYWVEGIREQAIRAMDVADIDVFPAASTLAKGEDIRGIAVDESTLYFIQHGSLFSVPLTGGSPRLLAENFSTQRVAVDANCVYGDGVNRMPKTGGPVFRSAFDARVYALDARRVYWSQEGVSGGVWGLLH